ncbi:unnamed protein product [Urochloa decumbens]|uniref:Aminotransferase-like plant mobile domain-containing protein n=1 Tax=Urochloa decumbens TaxID=240449 RepID=A0ABC8WZM5_9POAL
MAGGVATTLSREFTAPAVIGSPRFFLPRASGACLPPLPSPPMMPTSISPDLVVLDDGWIRANSGSCPAAEQADLWVQWVAKLRPLHEPLWRELGIRDGILATTCRVRRRGSEGGALLLQLVPFWSPETNTFVFPWGEATVTLEDAAVLAGLPLAGSPVREHLSDHLQIGDERALMAIRRGFLNQSNSAAGWIEHFLRRRHLHDDEETLEHGAFLSMWLSHFVLPSPPFDAAVAVPAEEVIPIAARLARGQGVALAPAALAGIYSDLSELKGHLKWSANKRTGAAAPSISAPTMQILQLWVWERFPELRPATAAAGIVDEVVGGEALEPGYIRAVFAAPKKFEWRPYGNRALKSFARCLRPCELVGMDDCVEQYSPHRVARQLGFDQDVPGIVTRLNSESWEKAWATYDIGAGCYEFAVPSDKPGVTDEYVQWWKPYSLSCATAFAERGNKGKAREEILGGENESKGGNGDSTVASNKVFDPLFGHSANKASKRGSGNRESSSSRLAEGNTGLGSSIGAVCTNTLYYLGDFNRSKEAWAKEANRTDAGQGYCIPKRAVGTMEMIQKASETRQAEKAELWKKIQKLAKEIREEEEAEALKK